MSSKYSEQDEDNIYKYDSFEYYQDKKYYKGKHILITGGTGGIGSLLVKKLLQLGAKLFLIFQNDQSFQKLYGDPNINSNPNLGSLKKDFTSQEISVADMKKIMTFFGGKLDILIMCHGKYEMSSMEDTNPDDFDSSNFVNVRATYNLLSMCSPFLRTTKGCCVAISSQEAKIPVRGGLLNSVTKSMVNSLVENAALELAPYGVRVNGVAPGITNTKMRVGINDNFGAEENKMLLENIGSYFPLSREVIQPDDVVDAILFLACDDAAFMTGEILTVDAGYSLNHDLCFAEQ